VPASFQPLDFEGSHELQRPEHKQRRQHQPDDPEQLSKARRWKVLEHNEGANYVEWSIPRQRYEAYAARRGPRGVITMDD
jgi:hypothetical protein